VSKMTTRFSCSTPSDIGLFRDSAAPRNGTCCTMNSARDRSMRPASHGATTQGSVIELLSLARWHIKPDAGRTWHPALLAGASRNGNARCVKNRAKATGCADAPLHECTMRKAPLARRGVTEGFNRYRRFGWLS
jgi:hypothetical protein